MDALYVPMVTNNGVLASSFQGSVRAFHNFEIFGIFCDFPFIKVLLTSITIGTIYPIWNGKKRGRNRKEN